MCSADNQCTFRYALHNLSTYAIFERKKSMPALKTELRNELRYYTHSAARGKMKVRERNTSGGGDRQP